MTKKQAHARYMRLFYPTMFIYVVAILITVYLRENVEVPRFVMILLSLIPALSMFSWMWGHWRYINELDEYLRSQEIRSMTIGLAVILSVATFWGLLEMLVDFPPLPVFYIVPGFYLVNGLSSAASCLGSRGEDE